MPRPKNPAVASIHGRKWRARFSLNGRQHTVPIGAESDFTPEEAAEAARQIEQDAIAQLAIVQRRRKSSTPLAKYNRRLDNRSEAHAENCERYRERLNKFLAGKPAAQDLTLLTQDDIEQWRDWLTAQPARSRTCRLSRKSINEHLNWLAAVFNHAGLPNPCRGVERIATTHAEKVEALKYFTPDEMQRMFEVGSTVYEPYYNAFLAYAFTGCRAAEIQGLRPEHIDKKNHAIYVTGKGQKTRLLPLTGPLKPGWDAIIRQAKNYPREDGFIFPQFAHWPRYALEAISRAAFGQERRVTSKKFRYSKRNKYEYIPLKPAHPHMLRHTFASMALLHWKPRWDIATLAKWLGHRDISLTYRTYMHWCAIEPPSGYEHESFRPELVQAKRKARLSQ